MIYGILIVLDVAALVILALWAWVFSTIEYIPRKYEVPAFWVSAVLYSGVNLLYWIL